MSNNITETKNQEPLLEIINVQKSFKKDRKDRLILDNVNLNLYPGQIVALLGKSGSGKSTLLRIMAGLIAPTSGASFYRGNKILQPVPGLAMIFQSFALLPWLTVLQNVELGLEAQGIPRSERRKKALHAIDIVGLDGFESAYPKELSGGMCQRVGFARALVVDPEILLMDEPFSALDVLTADNLRSDLLDLWNDKQTNIKSVLMVTHNIEEAVLMADRILVVSNNPGTIRADFEVDLPHPRHTQDPKFLKLVDTIYTYITMPSGPEGLSSGIRQKTINLGYRLPDVQVSELTGFIDTLNEPQFKDRRVDLPELADELSLGINDLFPITEVLEILRFAQVSQGDIELNNAGKAFANADMAERKKIFSQHLLNYVPLARHIRRVLDERPEHRASEDRFLTELEDYLSEDAAEDVLKVVIDWGRYAEIFAYDYDSGKLSLENPK